MKKIYAFMLVFILLLLCTGCSSEKPEDIIYNRGMHIDPMMYNAEELIEESSLVFEGVVVNISTKVLNRKTWQFQTLPIGTDDPEDYEVVTSYTVLVTLPYKGETGVFIDFISEYGNWYEMGPERKSTLERLGIDPKVGLMYYSLGAKLETGNSYMFCLYEMDGGKMMSTYYNLGLEGDSKYATEIKAQLTPQFPPLLTLGIIVVAVLAAAAVTTVLLIRKKKRKATPEETEQIPEET